MKSKHLKNLTLVDKLQSSKLAKKSAIIKQMTPPLPTSTVRVKVQGYL